MFFSKDLIIEILYSNLEILGIYGYLFGLFAAFFTCLYSFRLIYCVFFGAYKYSINTLYKTHNYSYYVIVVFILLLLGLSGFILQEILVSFGNHFLGSSIVILSQNIILNDIEFINSIVKFLPFFTFLFSIFIVYFFFIQDINIFMYFLKKRFFFLLIFLLFQKIYILYYLIIYILIIFIIIIFQSLFY